MNAAHWHLILNHLPVVGTLFLAFLLAAGLVQRSGQVQKLSLVFAVLVALSAIAAYTTGDPAEHVVENLPGVTSLAIHTHEEAGELALIASSITGALSLIGLIAFRRRDKLPRTFLAAVLAVGLVSAGVMAWAAELGGEIRHTEITSQPRMPVPISTLQQ